MTRTRDSLRTALAALAAFVAAVAVASAAHPGDHHTAAAHPSPPARAALVSSAPAAGRATVVAGARVVVRVRATGAFEAQALVLRLAAEGYRVVAAEGLAARAAVAQARAAGAFPATRFVAVSPRP
jgi:hypothetical protein